MPAKARASVSWSVSSASLSSNKLRSGSIATGINGAIFSGGASLDAGDQRGSVETLRVDDGVGGAASITTQAAVRTSTGRSQGAAH